MPSRNGQGLQSRRPTIVLLVLLALSLACVTVYAREGEDGFVHAAQHAVSGLAAPLKSASGAISAGEERIESTIEDATADPNSIVSLREQNEQLRSTIAALEEYRQEALRLEGLLEMRSTYAAQGIPARVLSRSTDSWNRVVTIDAGSSSGVRAGLPVMGSSGLVGQVVATTETSADVRLLSDSQSGVAVVIQSSREEGIVHGSLEGLLYLEDVGDEVEVEPGDVLLTSGLGGGYFRGIMVGTVLKVEGEAGATARKIIVEPNSEAEKAIEEVYVVTSMTSSIEGESSADGGQDGADGMIDSDGDGVADMSAGADDAGDLGYGYEYGYEYDYGAIEGGM